MAAQASVHVFQGLDSFSAREALRELRAGLGVSDANVIRLDGSTASLNEIAASAQSASFFAEPRLVIMEGLASRFGGRRRGAGVRGGGRRRGSEDAGSEIDRLAELLSSLPETTTVAILDEQTPSSLLDALKGIAKVNSFGIKRAPEIRNWARTRVEERGATISGQALDRLCEMVDGYHLGELAQEIDKLITYTDGRRIEAADVEEVGTGAVQHQTWDLTDAVVDGQAGRALRVLQRMDEKQHPAQLLHSMIVRQHRHVLTAQAMLREGFGAAQIGERLGIARYPLQKVIEQASRYPADRLEQALRRLLESDAAVKTGLMDIDTALELLIVDLAEIANAGRRGPATAARARP